MIDPHTVTAGTKVETAETASWSRERWIDINAKLARRKLRINRANFVEVYDIDAERRAYDESAAHFGIDFQALRHYFPNGRP